MRELMRTNDPVLISFVESVLGEAKITYLVLDANMSVMEGSLGILPRRVMVEDDGFDQAKRLLKDCDIDVPG